MPEEKSPGGSTIRRYASGEWADPQTGQPGDFVPQFAAPREEAYKELLGEPRSIDLEAIPLVPRIDIHTYVRSSPKEEVVALVTSGMSDLPMHVPTAAGEDAPRRVELIFYCLEPRPEYIETLRWVGRFVHDQKTWLSYGHTMPNGNPPAAFWGSDVLDTLLFMPTIVRRDQALSEELVLAGDPVHFLWVVPISTPECDLKLEQGFGAILDLFQEHRHPHVFNPARKSYV